MTTTIQDLFAIDHGVTPDDTDAALLASKVAALNEVRGPRVGDFVEFTDGVVRRFSHDWGNLGLQTSLGGSFHLGHGHVSFSGSLDRVVPLDALTDAEETRAGDVWFFHHNHSAAHHGVGARVQFRVYWSTLASTDRGGS